MPLHAYVFNFTHNAVQNLDVKASKIRQILLFFNPLRTKTKCRLQDLKPKTELCATSTVMVKSQTDLLL